MKLNIRFLALILLIALPSGVGRAAIVLGGVDNFQGGTTEGWQHGISNPRAPANIADAGPLGSGDRALQFSSSGLAGPASRFVAFNTQADWTGDYITAGVTAITLDVNNTGANPLALRLSFDGAGGDWVTNPIAVVAGSGWQSLTFDIQTTSLVGAAGATSAVATMSGVGRMEILSAVGIQTGGGGLVVGDVIAASARFDNITAASITAIPEPLSALLLLALMAGMCLIRQRKPTLATCAVAVGSKR